MADQTIPAVYKRIADGITQAVDAGEFVTKWTALVEIIDADGDRGLYLLDSDENTAWDTMGMLEYALQKAKSRADMATWYSTPMHSENDEDDEY